jgi:four helix bundle suffix protein
MPGIYRQSGGYRKLHSFNFAAIIHLGTISFCRRYIHRRDDPLGKTVGQMVGASRSGKQNIVEGSERAKTSSEAEIKLTDVAKASLSELQGDFEDYLAQKGEVPWSIHEPDHEAIMSIMLDEFDYTEDLLHDYWTSLLTQKSKFDPWIEERDDMAAANALIILIQRGTGLLTRQLAKLEATFVEKGGVKERMYHARQDTRNEPDAPSCPDCGAPMRRRRSARGPFWGCSTYPQCRGTRSTAEESERQ